MAARGKAQSRAPKKTPSSLVDDIVVPRPIWDQFTRIGGSLTPAAVSSIIREADTGRPARLVDLMHEARQKDCHLQSVLQTRELAVKGLTWDVLAAGDKPLKRELKAAKRLKEAVEESEGFSETIAHLTGEGTLFGFAWVEVIWKKADDGLLVPARFKPVSCRRFGFHSADGRLLFDPVGHGAIDADGVDLLETYPPGKFICYAPRVNGDVQLREGLCRALLWAALFRNWDIRDWLTFAELAWKPLRRAQFKKQTVSKEDREKMRKHLAAWLSDGVLVHGDSIEVFLEAVKNTAGTGSAGGPHEQLARWLGEEMSKAVLGSSDIVEPGKNGARAATAERGGLRKDILEADATGESAVLTAMLARPFFAMNYGPRMRPSNLALITEDTVNLKEFSETISNLVTSKLRIPAQWVRETVGIPEPEQDDEIIGGEPEQPDPDDPAAKPAGEPQEPDDAEDEPSADAAE